MTTGQIQTPENERLPKWSRDDQDFWIEFFIGVSDTIISAMMFSEERKLPIDRLKDGVRAAAQLADTAVEEAQYRGWVQKDVRRVERRQRRKW